MIDVAAATEIAASADTVWRVLNDLERYSEWNPFIRRAWGSLEIGGIVHVRVKPRRGVRLPFQAEVVEREEARWLRWQGHVGATWIASGDHAFEIEPIDDRRVRFVQRERFGGVLPRLGARMLARVTERGFRAMNRTLAARAEYAELATRRAA